MSNCIVEKGRLRKRPGYGKFPSDHAGFGEAVMGLFACQDDDKVQFLYALTPTAAYVYNEGSKAWDPLSGATLNGTSETLYTFEFSQGKMVFSQGVDKVQAVTLTLSSPSYADLDANCPAARYLCRFADRLNLGHTYESSIQKPYRLRRSVSGNHADWTGLGSGFRDYPESFYHLHGLKKLGTQLISYYEKGIESAVRQINAAAPYRHELRVEDIGLQAPHTLRGRNDLHFFLGNDDFYSFNGATPLPIGQAIRNDVFQLINTSQYHKMFGHISNLTQEYSSFLVSGGQSYPDHAWVFNWGRGIWYRWNFPNHSHRCAVTHRVEDAVTIDELVGTIDEQAWEFDSLAVQGDYPAMYTGAQDGYVYRWSTVNTSDDGDEIYSYWTSQDFTAERVFQTPGKKIILERIVVEFVGIGQAFDLEFEYSIDGGETWTIADTVTAGNFASGLHTLLATRRVSGDRIRFRVSQTSATESFIITKFECEFSLDEGRENAA